MMEARDVTPAVCFGDCNGAYKIAQSVGKSDKLCKDGSPFQNSQDLCLQCIEDNIEGTKQTKRDYVEPKFQQFNDFCKGKDTTSATTAAPGPESQVTATPDVETKSQVEATSGGFAAITTEEESEPELSSAAEPQSTDDAPEPTSVQEENTTNEPEPTSNVPVTTDDSEAGSTEVVSTNDSEPTLTTKASEQSAKATESPEATETEAAAEETSTDGSENSEAETGSRTAQTKGVETDSFETDSEAATETEGSESASETDSSGAATETTVKATRSDKADATETETESGAAATETTETDASGAATASGDSDSESETRSRLETRTSTSTSDETAAPSTVEASASRLTASFATFIALLSMLVIMI
ncbi:hypothetical protein NXS19_008834 [Fusarium pseudograminearum]|nr:hypothetical protein NXS19_008834 [Fusarium pseudograminearum]